MLTIDGSQGEGGGQIIRSSLALSLITDQPVTLKNIRARRNPSGLRRQHLTAVSAARDVGNATVDGAAIGSSEIIFRPQQVQPGTYEFDIGTAGSTSLVLQTILPALIAGEQTSTITLKGGTHNPFAPPFDFLERAYLPLLHRMGPQVTADLRQPGFYPAGGGHVVYEVKPAAKLIGLELSERGKITQRQVTALVARLPRHIGERECDTVAKKSGWPRSEFAVEEIDNSAGPGNALLIALTTPHLTEVFTEIGEKGVTAEQVAQRAYQQARRYLKAEVPVGEYLADQLLLPMGLAAAEGERSLFRTHQLSEHSLTHIDVLKKFLAIEIDVTEEAADRFLVSVGPA